MSFDVSKGFIEDEMRGFTVLLSPKWSSGKKVPFWWLEEAEKMLDWMVCRRFIGNKGQA